MTWVVPGYTELDELGRGGAGRVVLGQHDGTGMTVAIKYLADELCRDEQFILAFRAEAQLLVKINNSNVVRLFEYIETDAAAAIVMELVDGVSLRALLREYGATAPESALYVLKGSLLGLAAAHERGVIHRDYKPDNVLIDSVGSSKLADFGIAARVGNTGPAAGTPAYMAPEQWRGKPATPQTDIYSATVTFFECVTGTKPFTGATAMDLQLQHEHAAIPADAVPEQLRGLVERGMAKDYLHRPDNAMTFVAELEAVAATGYGPEWEKHGQQKLAERAALLALLFPLAGEPTCGTGTATTRLGVGRRGWAAIGATLLLFVIAGTTAFGLSNGETGLQPNSSGSSDVGPSAIPSIAADSSHPASPSSEPSPSPVPTQNVLSTPDPETGPTPGLAPPPLPTSPVTSQPVTPPTVTLTGFTAATCSSATVVATLRITGSNPAAVAIKLRFSGTNDPAAAGGFEVQSVDVPASSNADVVYVFNASRQLRAAEYVGVSVISDPTSTSGTTFLSTTFRQCSPSPSPSPSRRR